MAERRNSASVELENVELHFGAGTVGSSATPITQPFSDYAPTSRNFSAIQPSAQEFSAIQPSAEHFSAIGPTILDFSAIGPSAQHFSAVRSSSDEIIPRPERSNPFQAETSNAAQLSPRLSIVSSHDSIDPTVLAGLKPPSSPPPALVAASSGRPVLPPIGLLNPSYDPYPLEPPPAYGPQTANFGGPGPSNSLSAAAGTNQAISLNGRSSVAVVCPFCCNSILTVTTESPSPVFRRSAKSYYPYAGFLVFILALFGILMFMAGSIITLYAIPVFIVFILFAALYSSKQQRRMTDQLFPDITHSCPLCQKTLGVSSGFQFLQMTQANTQRY